MNKNEIFRYLIVTLIKKGVIKTENDFSVLKVLKLLFLMCQTSSMVFESDEDLFELFTFRAFTYGPVEQDIYNRINEDYFRNNFIITTEKTIINSVQLNDYNGVNNERIISFINAYINQFSNLFRMKAFELVELTHKYDSWNKAYKEKSHNNMYPEMNIELMRSENFLV